MLALLWLAVGLQGRVVDPAGQGVDKALVRMIHNRRFESVSPRADLGAIPLEIAVCTDPRVPCESLIASPPTASGYVTARTASRSVLVKGIEVTLARREGALWLELWREAERVADPVRLDGLYAHDDFRLRTSTGLEIVFFVQQDVQADAESVRLHHVTRVNWSAR